jgi:NTE family protein
VTEEARVGLVLAGGGARGAYEVGALSVILPELERRGERPTYFVGASVGAINALGFAARQHLPAEQACAEMLGIWGNLTKDQVMRPIVSHAAAPLAVRFVGQMLGVPGVRVQGLLDNAPLPQHLARWADWDRLHSSVREGLVHAISVVATSVRTGKTVAFVEGAMPPELHRSRAIAYVQGELAVEHVLASASIPILWAPTLITTPPRAKGWYFDGGTRMNTPIKPLLDLGAERLVIVALESAAGPVLERGRDDEELETPDLGDGISHLLEGTLVDPLIDDLIKLGNINSFLVGEEAGAGPKLYRTTRGKRPYREVPYVFVAPERRGAIGELATEVFQARYGGLRGALRSIDFRLIHDLLGGPSPAHGELLSLLFFDRDFIEELIRIGREDAQRWLAAEHDGGGPWRLSPLDVLTRPRQWTAG